MQYIPGRNDWAEAFRGLGAGAAEGYINRSDENAVRNAIAGLGSNASARDILDTLTNTKTYRNDAKHRALQNYLGVEQFEELKRKAKAAEGFDKAKFDEEKRATKRAEEQRDRQLDITEEKANKTKKDVNRAQAAAAGLQTIKEMKDIGKKGNLGVGTGVRGVFSGEAAKDAAQYEQLGLSLIHI